MLYHFIFLGSFLTFAAHAFWHDKQNGVDWVLMAGHYTAQASASMCANHSRGYRVPEIEELTAAHANGIQDPVTNPSFSHLLAKRGRFLSATKAVPSGAKSPRQLWDFALTQSSSEIDSPRNFRGLLCVSVPQERRYWLDAKTKLYWERGHGRSGLGAAQSSCQSPLGNTWLPSIEELETGYHHGMTDPDKNLVFAKSLKAMPLLLSSTEVSARTQWALEIKTGQRIKVPVGVGYQYYYLCLNLFD